MHLIQGVKREEWSGRTLVIKAVNAVYTGTFVVTAENKEVFRILDLVSQ